ncbi:hypothetical protein [Deefgea rivuli]|uniref:hypothetical protein n=1 Tax=Deefgea rivuli TaxID=400948 RepID=UPI0004832998|nr:hypothetical protein [Deefgea rivuli]
MYDCLEIDVKPSKKLTLKSPAVTKNQRINLSRYREQSVLQLRAAPYTGPQSLLRAFAAANSFSWPTQNMSDGSLLIFGLHCEEALLFQRRFPELLATFEPARPIPKGYSCPV